MKKQNNALSWMLEKAHKVKNFIMDPIFGPEFKYNLVRIIGTGLFINQITIDQYSSFVYQAVICNHFLAKIESSR